MVSRGGGKQANFIEEYQMQKKGKFSKEEMVDPNKHLSNFIQLI